jgi:hypothetical protein
MGGLTSEERRRGSGDLNDYLACLRMLLSVYSEFRFNRFIHGPERSDAFAREIAEASVREAARDSSNAITIFLNMPVP